MHIPTSLDDDDDDGFDILMMMTLRDADAHFKFSWWWWWFKILMMMMMGVADFNSLDDDDDDFDGIHPEYQWRIYLLVNPPLVYPPGHHHHHHQFGEKIQARVSIEVYLKMAKNRQRDEVHFHFSKNIVQFEFEGVSSQRSAVVQRSSLLLPFCF